MELQIGKIYVMKEAETSSDGTLTFLKKGTKVRLSIISGSHVLVQELSEDALDDGLWATEADKLVTEEEYAAMQEADDAAGVEPIQLKRGAIYVMKRPEVSGDGRITYLKKGARVRIENFGRDSVLVQDLSDDMVGDGVWMTHASYLMPLAEASAKNTECFVKEHDADVKNKHYISDHQPIETMQSNMTHEEMIGFLKGNIIKYACRCGKKDEPLKEAEKIKQYAEWLCIVLSGGTINPRS